MRQLLVKMAAGLGLLVGLSGAQEAPSAGGDHPPSPARLRAGPDQSGPDQEDRDELPPPRGREGRGGRRGMDGRRLPPPPRDGMRRGGADQLDLMEIPPRLRRQIRLMVREMVQEELDWQLSQRRGREPQFDGPRQGPRRDGFGPRGPRRDGFGPPMGPMDGRMRPQPDDEEARPMPPAPPYGRRGPMGRGMDGPPMGGRRSGEGLQGSPDDGGPGPQGMRPPGPSTDGRRGRRPPPPMQDGPPGE
jgi:hypothetical protein